MHLPSNYCINSLRRSGFHHLFQRSGFHHLFRRDVRTVYSTSGEWPQKLTLEKKRQLEEFWKPKIRSATRRPADRGKYYVLSMFPYPSGKLHMGHVRVYAISDAMARYRRLQGYEVIHPMGWDAFGLPAENAASEQGVPAHKWTMANIDKMKSQLMELGFAFDWNREITTCDPAYYKWTQHLFLKLWDAGLVYEKEAFVNWDPVDETVLANEQVDEKGNSWRSGAKVERKLLKQWFIRTSDYAAKLSDGLDSLVNWDEVVKLQKSWIGEISGYWITMDVVDPSSGQCIDQVKVFTSDKNSVFAGAFIVLSSSHELFAKIKSKQSEGPLECRNPLTKQSEGPLEFKCRNPFTDDLLPIFSTDDAETPIADCDAYLGIPWICENDQLFAESKSLDLGVEKKAIWVEAKSGSQKYADLLDYGVDAGCVSGLSSAKLKDWLISRQRYWGTPIPIIKCSTCGPVPVPYEALPVTLPLFDQVSTKGGSTLAETKDWIHTACPRCNKPALRETDTMDTFVDSSWYFLRYLDSQNQTEPFSKEVAFSSMPVDLYIGGKEHALMHLFYARFIGYFLYDQKLLPVPEPFKNLLTQGYVQGRALIDRTSGKYLRAEEVETVDGKLLTKNGGHPVKEEWTKMSKSKYNGLDPEDAVAEYGVDSTRLFMLGNISPRSHRKWDPELFKGLLNWESNIWSIVAEYLKRNADGMASNLTPEELQKHEALIFDSRNFYLKGLNHVLDKHYTMNVAISKLLALTSSLRKVPAELMNSSAEFRRTLQDIIIMTFPFSPHFAAELWSGIRSVSNVKNISATQVWQMDWPQLDSSYSLDLVLKICENEVDAVKLPRSEFDVLTKEDAVKIAMNSPKMRKYLKATPDPSRQHFTFHPDYEAVINIIDVEAKKQLEREKKALKKMKM